MADPSAEGRWPSFRGELEDFWRREVHAVRFGRDIEIFGHIVRIETNDEAVWKAVDIARRSYSTDSPTGPRYSMQIIVDDRLGVGEDPAGRLPGEISYAGAGDWLSLALGPWGRAHIDLASREAVLIIGPDLAAASSVLARWVIHTIWTNFLLRADSAMLHATSLHREGTVLCFVGTHNMGKSTTALQLAVRGGWELLSDSQVYVDDVEGRLRLNAFPVGRVGLRRDMLDRWPELEGAAERLSIREEHKYEVDLTAVAPDRVRARTVIPERVIICLIGRHDAPETVVSGVSVGEVLDAMVLNSMFLDTDEAWSVTLGWLERLAAEAECHRVVVGTDGSELIAAVDRIAAGPA